MANDFGRVCCEHQANIQFPQQGFHLSGGNVHPSQSLEDLAEGRRVGLAGEGWGEGIEGIGFGIVLSRARTQAVEVAVFLDALLEDVDQLEIERERPSCSNGLREIHGADQLNDGFAAAVPIAALQGYGVAELFQTEKTLALFGRAFAAQDGLPQVFDQLEAVLEQASGSRTATAHPGLFAFGGMGGGLGH